MGTELLIGVLITVVTRFVKWLTKKLGGEMAGALTLIVAFILSLVAAFIWKGFTNGVDYLKDWQTVVSLFGLSMVWYEVMVKRIIAPILAKFKKAKPV